ncbi:MAG: hemerythrin domain-containing protein, partial [Bacteroidia bacterium]|nr:hemerythrin domain-containing protein [Bacteroidia bacterium]
GSGHSELFKIKELFLESASDLAAHMKKEELILFPFIRKLVATEKDPSLFSQPKFGSIKNPIEMMKHDHDTEGERFRQIAELSNNYKAPSDGCNTYKVTFSLLKEFEDDLHLHIHLENNILFPKSIELEKSIRSDSMNMS